MPARTWNYAPVGSTHDVLRRVAQKARNKVITLSDCLRPTVTATNLCPASGPSSIPIPPPPPINKPLYMSITKGLGSSSLRNAIATEAEKIKQIVASSDEPESSDLIDRAIHFSLENLSEEDVYHRAKVSLTLAENQQKTNVIVAGLLLDIGYEAINKEFGTGIAELVIGTTKLKPFAYNCAMEKSPTSTEQKFLVLLARIKEVPDMACHIIQAIAVLEELKISMASNQLMIRQETPKILTEKIALAQEAAALQTEVLARLGYNRLAAELVNAAGYHLDPQAYTKAKGNIETTIGMKLEKSKDELTQLNKRLAANVTKNHGIYCRAECRQKEVVRMAEKMAREAGGWDTITDFWGVRWIFDADEKDVTEYIKKLRQHITEKLEEEGWEKFGDDQDFITKPKDNDYRSYQMHFSKELANGQLIMLAVQLRNEQMDIQAEHGLASHWAAYKQNLAGYDSLEFDGQLKRLGNTHAETIAMRWEYLKNLAWRYSFAYVINGSHRPKAAQLQLDWPNIKIVKVFLGQRELAPSLLDVALAASSPQALSPGYCLNSAGAIADSSGQPIENGGLVYLNRTSKRRMSETDFKNAKSPWSQAVILLELMKMRNTQYDYKPALPGQDKLDSTRQAFEQLINDKTDKINQADFVFPETRQTPRIAVFKDLDLAARRAGLGSAETIALCLSMADDPAKISSLFLDKLDKEIKKTLVYCAFFDKEGENESSLYVLPAEDRPGVLWFIITYLVQSRLNIKALFSHNQGSKRGFHIITSKKSNLEACCAEFSHMQARLKENFKKPAAGTHFFDGRQYQFTLRFSGKYNDLLPYIFMCFGKNLMTLQDIHAARREEGHESSVTFTCKIKKRNRLSFESSQIKRLIKEINDRTKHLGGNIKINYSLINE